MAAASGLYNGLLEGVDVAGDRLGLVGDTLGGVDRYRDRGELYGDRGGYRDRDLGYGLLEEVDGVCWTGGCWEG